MQLLFLFLIVIPIWLVGKIVKHTFKILYWLLIIAGAVALAYTYIPKDVSAASGDYRRIRIDGVTQSYRSLQHLRSNRYIVYLPRVVSQVQASKRKIYKEGKDSVRFPQAARSSNENSSIAQAAVRGQAQKDIKVPTKLYTTSQLVREYKLLLKNSPSGQTATPQGQKGLNVDKVVFLPYSGLLVLETEESLDTIQKHFQKLGYPKVQVAPDYLAVSQGWQVVSYGGEDKAYPQDFDNVGAPMRGLHWFLEGVKAPQAWYAQGCHLAGPTACGGDSNVVVAVLDTGVSFFNQTGVKFTYYNQCSDLDGDGSIDKYTECTIPFTQTGYLTFVGDISVNPALNSARLWTNPNESLTPQCNDLHGVDMDMYIYNQNQGIPANCTLDNRVKEGLPYDDYGHGTFVASLINATADDSATPLGASFNVTIMPIKISKPFTGTAYASVMAEAIYYAVDNGANIINLSFGFDAISPPSVLDAAIQYAYDNNVMIVAASGNAGLNRIFWPAAYAKDWPNVVAVGSVYYDGAAWHKTYYSNYGAHLTLVAPGGVFNSSSQYINPMLGTSLDCSSNSCVPNTTNSNGEYVFDYTVHATLQGIGTSYSTPLVSAGLALVIGKYPNLQPEDYRSALLGATQDIDAPGYDKYTGAGLINFKYLQNITQNIYIDKITVTSQVKHISFPSAFGSRPVVIARRSSWFGQDGGSVVVKNVTPEGFDIYLREWPGYDGSHLAEEVAVIAAEFSSASFKVNRAILEVANYNVVRLQPGFSTKPYIILSNTWADGGEKLAPRLVDETYSASQKGATIAVKEIPGTTTTDAYVQAGFLVFDTLFNSGQVIPINLTAQNAALVNFNGQNTPPVMIWQQITENEQDLVYVKIDDYSATHATLRLVENQRAGQDGSHGQETVNIFYWPYSFNDDYLAFKFNANSEINFFTFPRPLPETPLLLANIQSENGVQPANFRFWKVTRAGFSGFVEEDISTGLDGYHVVERIGALAALPSSTTFSGNIGFKQVDHNKVALGFLSDILFDLQTRNGHQTAWIDVIPQNADMQVYVQENPKSLDGTHLLETFGYLKTGAYLNSLGIESGKVSVDHNWKKVNLSSSYTAPPVIIADIVTENGTDPVRVDIRNVTTTSFELRLEEPINYDGWHLLEDVVWIAVQ